MIAAPQLARMLMAVRAPFPSDMKRFARRPRQIYRKYPGGCRLKDGRVEAPEGEGEIHRIDVVEIVAPKAVACEGDAANQKRRPPGAPGAAAIIFFRNHRQGHGRVRPRSRTWNPQPVSAAIA